jgi:hypothetical protein
MSSMQETLNEFNLWLEHRNSEIERRLQSTQSEGARALLRAEQAELQVIQAKFVAMFVLHMPLASGGVTPSSIKLVAAT